MCSCRQTGRDSLLSETYGLVRAPGEGDGTVTVPVLRGHGPHHRVADPKARTSQRASRPWAVLCCHRQIPEVGQT